MAKTLDWWPSPAKLNLFLHINERLKNGYHELQSLFQILTFGDEIAFEVTHEPTIKLMTPIKDVRDEDNLIIKAALLLKASSHCELGCKIWINKHLPMGGGIGGGSSNAATVLVALNQLWQCGLSQEELANLGLRLGADVPIFVKGRTAFAEGVGEKIYPTELESKVYLVVFPNCHVSTGEIFQSPDLPRKTPKIRFETYNFATTTNDCEKVVCNRYPKVANILHWLLEYAPSRMTGTGACLFAVFDDADKARLLMEELPEDCTAFISKGVNYSPLLEKLKSHKSENDSN